MKRWRRTAGTLAVLGLVAHAPSSAQTATDPSGWTVGATGMVASWREETDPFDQLGGPGLTVDLYRPRGVGAGVRAGYIMPTGFYGMRGAWAHAMLMYGIPTGRHQLQVKGGAAGFVGNDSDGSMYAGGGPVAGAGMLFRPTRRVGVQLDGFTQVFYVPDDFVLSPGASVSLMLLPRGGR